MTFGVLVAEPAQACEVNESYHRDFRRFNQIANAIDRGKGRLLIRPVKDFVQAFPA
jgi:hypothetical protein